MDKHAAQPFNIGKYSRVAKASASELALSDDDTPTLPKPAAARSRPRASAASSAAKAKAQPKGHGKPKKAEASDESEVPPAAGDDFAMDSDEEERQLKAAIRASAARGVTDKFGSASTTEVNSRASSAMPSTGRKGAAGRSTAPSTPSTGRKSRVAAIKSAESELKFSDERIRKDCS
jgi:DNA repair protein RAD16